ncbi:MAG: oxidoreductase [Thermodesulfovibrio sp.]|nr:oxidoreductase [Thermodesulfovibrio sp.]
MGISGRQKVMRKQAVVISGGCGLIGKAIAEEIYKKGYITIVTDLANKNSEEAFQNLQNTLKAQGYESLRDLEFLEMNITSQDSIKNCIEYIKNKYECINAFINASYPRGKNYGKRLEEVSYEDFCETVNLHLGGFFLSSKLFAEFFKQQGYGNVINFSSIYGVIAPRFEIYEGTEMTMPIEYAAIKSAIIHITKYMAKYYKGYNIRFNCISPGGIIQAQSEVFLSNYKKYCLNKGMLEAKDVVGAVIFLLSEESKFINGQNLIVDDGFTL